ncbi:MAG: phosphatase PAP2 family protein [Saprospiraceae bacterium]|nr:phosphatase PAP2 family protein [Saprospiraceae bacterium]
MALKNLINENTFLIKIFLLYIYVLFIAVIALPEGVEFILVNHIKGYYSDIFFRYATKLGEEYPYFLTVAYLWFFKKNIKRGFFIGFIGAVVTVVSYLAKQFFLHPRPFVILQQKGWLPFVQFVDDVVLNKGYQSLPSGHTLSAFTIFTYLSLCYGYKNKAFVAIAMLLAALCGFSRVYLIQHFLSDVLLGSIMGFCLGISIFLVENTYLKTNIQYK